MKWDSPQFILTVLILAGFAGIVTVVLFVPMPAEKADIVKSIMSSMGAACLLAIGYWFGPGKNG
jgi:peptidoglycan/LPS O-acetylase OafA/YrhL